MHHAGEVLTPENGRCVKGFAIVRMLPCGEPEEIRAVSRRTMADANGRRYFLGSSTELHWDVKLENGIVMFETAHGDVFSSTVSLPPYAM